MNLKLPIALLALGLLSLGVHTYLRYEQKNEMARYQLGYSQGIEIGELRQREEFKRNFNCYRITASNDTAGVVICGVLEPMGKDGMPVDNFATDPSDLEQ